MQTVSTSAIIWGMRWTRLTKQQLQQMHPPGQGPWSDALDVNLFLLETDQIWPGCIDDMSYCIVLAMSSATLSSQIVIMKLVYLIMMFIDHTYTLASMLILTINYANWSDLQT